MSALADPPPLDGVVDEASPEQIVASVIAATDGFGLTVTVTLKAVPEQLPEVGVTE
jgi:hypothetical protein